MAFDAGMVRAIVNELSNTIVGSKVEKIYQPQNEEFIFVLNCQGRTVKLLVNGSSSNQRINITNLKIDNPINPSSLCMLYRKHLNGATILSVEQYEFDRVIKISFSSYDEMGYPTQKYLIFEIMGKYSNLLLLSENKKIINVIKPIDFTSVEHRQLLPGMTYETPEKQNRINPLEISKDEFSTLVNGADNSKLIESFIINNFAGISKPIAKEISYRCNNKNDDIVENNKEKICKSFFDVITLIKNNKFMPYSFVKDGIPKEYTFINLTYLSGVYNACKMNSFSELIDFCYEQKANAERMKQHGNDILRIVNNAENKLIKKIARQKSELLECDDSESYRINGELITSNIYQLKKGMTCCEVFNYYNNDMVKIPLDCKLTPAQNAQKYYKKYNKLKNARAHLEEQISIASNELNYILSVKDSYSRSSSDIELQELREELFLSGYASKMRNFKQKKKTNYLYNTFVTTNGYTVLCGKNNISNDYITFKVAKKHDWWFHVKNIHGSHVVMLIDGKDEPDTVDFTDAASIAAYYSQANGSSNTEVDYTIVKNVKKPPNGKPGFVIYNTNWSAVVSPDREKINRMRK